MDTNAHIDMNMNTCINTYTNICTYMTMGYYMESMQGSMWIIYKIEYGRIYV
jgi:hypothetical protein